jgi:hypothetical protein
LTVGSLILRIYVGFKILSQISEQTKYGLN